MAAGNREVKNMTRDEAMALDDRTHGWKLYPETSPTKGQLCWVLLRPHHPESPPAEPNAEPRVDVACRIEGAAGGWSLGTGF